MAFSSTSLIVQVPCYRLVAPLDFSASASNALHPAFEPAEAVSACIT
jgi:hypothetical protein